MVMIYFQDHHLLFTMRTEQRIIDKRRKDYSTPPVKTTESIVGMRDITSESIITVTAFRDETMDMRIPFKIPAESMQDHDKTRGKVFVFVHFRE